MLIKTELAGTVLDLTNDGKDHQDVVYACVTAPALAYLEIKIDGVVFDGVWVGPGSSHSWWTMAGGKFLPQSGVRLGAKILITATGPVALRIDWNE